MSNIAKAFGNKKAFLGFVTGGDPNMEICEACVFAMIRGGATLIEIGIPFSDPIAEGPVIQAANLRALAQGTTTDKIFDLVKRLRAKTQIPIVFLTYLNPVFHYGYDAFFAKCAAVGVDGIIIPDMPFEEQGELRGITQANGVDLISLIAPTSEQRIAEIARQASGFIYLVSSMGVTGTRHAITTDLSKMVRACKAATDLPVAIGFGVHTPQQAQEIRKVADGIIVGSAIVKLVENHRENAPAFIENYVRELTADA
ncbi:MAG: tryptophan synthase subunit alpha [Oscillospiraceae bacterium]|jgi:tryptophan synthase alpha chain|nr:tryptophan synthase subunit alpha [Oscillospiraceae bacterium]